MEAIDLMIDDWVSYGGIPIKVENVYKYCINFQHDIPFVQEEFLIEQTEICPIPLTQEILEKNGWVYNNEDEKFFPKTWVCGGLMLRGADDCGYCIVVTSDYDDEDTNDTPFIILYVHELQHALRLRRIKKEIIL